MTTLMTTGPTATDGTTVDDVAALELVTEAHTTATGDAVLDLGHHPVELPRVLRVRSAPRREPPFDDECAGLRVPPIGVFDRPLPFVRVVDTTPVFAAPPPAHSGMPDPALWARRLLIGIVEAAGGKRPLQQLTTLLTPAIAHGLRSDFHRAVAGRARHWTHAATVRSVRASEPTPGIAEVCATLQLGRRVRAVALRAEADQGRWRCTRLHLG